MKSKLFTKMKRKLLKEHIDTQEKIIEVQNQTIKELNNIIQLKDDLINRFIKLKKEINKC